MKVLIEKIKAFAKTRAHRDRHHRLRHRPTRWAGVVKALESRKFVLALAAFVANERVAGTWQAV